MEKKGLCSTCNEDKTCSFARRFPVLQCEEFDDYANHRYVSKAKLKKTRYSEEVTEAE